MRNHRSSSLLECIYIMDNVKSKENIIEGKNALIETVNSGRGVKKLFVLKGLKDEKINSIIDTLKKTGTVVSFKDRDEIDKISETKANQGIIAEVEDFKYVTVDDILDYAKEKGEVPFIILIDEVSDPHNFGAIIRTAECVGAHGIIIKNRNQTMVTATVVSASAGASNYVRIARVTNLSKTIDDLKEKGLWFACADMDGTEMTRTNLNGSIGLVVGSEGSGVSRLVKEKCDYVVKIPMKGHIDSLNVSVATAVLAYEIHRQRNS